MSIGLPKEKGLDLGGEGVRLDNGGCTPRLGGCSYLPLVSARISNVIPKDV